MAIKDIVKAVSPLAMVASSNPDMLRGLGLVGNIAANKLENREEDKQRRAMEAAAGQAPQPGMKKGGKVSSASKRADGIATKGKTKGRIV